MKQSLSTPRGTFSIRTYGDPAHPPIILVHGWPQTSYCWHHMAAHLEGLYVVAPDLRGMGDSNRELDKSWYEKDQLGRDIFAIADALGMDQFYLGGHDWGGAVVQEMAFLHPDRIQKLIICNMIIIHSRTGKDKASSVQAKYLFRSSWYQFFMSIKEFPEALLSGKEDIWVRFFSRGISNPVPEDAIEEYTRCYKIPNSITTAANLYRTMPQDIARWRTFEGKSIEIPTKIIHGVLDPVIIKEYLTGVEDVFASVEVAHLNGGHFIVDEQPEAVAVEVKEFLL